MVIPSLQRKKPNFRETRPLIQSPTAQKKLWWQAGLRGLLPEEPLGSQLQDAAKSPERPDLQVQACPTDAATADLGWPDHVRFYELPGDCEEGGPPTTREEHHASPLDGGAGAGSLTFSSLTHIMGTMRKIELPVAS